MLLLGLFLAFALVILASQRKINLGHALVAGSALLWLVSPLSASKFLWAIAHSIVDPNGLTLMLIIGLLSLMARLMEASGHTAGLLTRFQNLIRSPRLNLALFPAFIGLLPIPGGAIFSAPLVHTIAQGLDLSPTKKSLINYWFRHVWEYSWPLYPSLIMIAALAGMPVGRLVRYSGVLSLGAILSGAVLVLRGVPVRELEDTAPSAEGVSLFKGLLPILIVLVGAMFGSELVRHLGRHFLWLGELPAQTPMALSLIGAVIAAAWTGRRFRGVFDKAFFKGTSSLIYLVAAVLVFKSVALASGAITALGQVMSALHLPLPAMVGGVSFFIGLATGYPLAYVGTGFPVFLGLLPPGAEMPYLVLGHLLGFAGVLLSPAHPCLILSNQYFHAPAARVYARLWPPVALSLGAGLIWVLVLFQTLD